jgi:adenylate kinase family enzyme
MDEMQSYSRVIVIGTSCAGKSTFAQSLADSSACKYIELDNLHWGLNWQPKPAEIFHRLVTEAAAGESWVADGNYGAVRELLWQRATAIVWLNYSYPRVLWQALKRTMKRSLKRELLWHGNRESVWRSFFSRESILVWVATTYHRRQRDFAALRASGRFAHLTWHEFRDPAHAHQWLTERQNAKSTQI